MPLADADRPPDEPGRPRLRARLGRFGLRVLRVLALAYLGVLLVLSALQSRLIFPGQESQGTPAAAVQPSPGAVVVELASADGEPIVALFGRALTGDGGPRADAAGRPTLLYFYGNGESLAGSLAEFEAFRRLGANVLVADYLGYGLSGGTAGESSCYATADAAYDHLLDRPDVDPGRIVAAGWSLGGAVAIDLASRRPVAGLASFSTFTTMAEMVRLSYPLPGLTLLLRHRFESLAKIGRIACPTLIGHGDGDALVPATMSDRLAAAAGGQVETFRVASGHGDFFLVDRERTLDALGRLVERVAEASPSRPPQRSGG